LDDEALPVEAPDAVLDSDIEPPEDELPGPLPDSDDELPESDDELPESDDELPESDDELLDWEDDASLVTADETPAADCVVVEFAVVPELPQADASRLMMPTAATPEMDLRNMKASRNGSAWCRRPMIGSPSDKHDPLPAGGALMLGCHPFPGTAVGISESRAENRHRSCPCGGGRFAGMPAVMATGTAAGGLIRRHRR